MGPGYGYGHGFGHFGAFGGAGWIGMIFGALFGLALLVAFILLIVWLVRMATHRGGGYHYMPQQAGVQPPQSTAMEILQTRYAKGEITREEYKQMQNDIGKTG